MPSDLERVRDELAAQLHSHLAELPVEPLRLLVTDADRTLTELRAAPANA